MTLKNEESISRPSWQVARAYAPSGKVKPHQPMLKGNFLHRRIDADAKKSHTSPNAQKTSAVMNPIAYTVGMMDLSNRKLDLANVSFAVSPSFKTLDAEVYQLYHSCKVGDRHKTYEKAPDPRGPIGRKTLTIVSFGGSLWIVSRWK